MKLKYITLSMIMTGSLGLTFSSCTGKFDDYNTNKNLTNKVTPAMLATDLILDILQIGGSKYSLYDNMLNKQIAWAEGSQQAEQYNRFGRVDFGTYTNMTNCQKMLMEAETVDENVLNSYKGLAKFVKAWNLFHLSMKVGDIPYSESNQADDGNITPKYDTQKEVMRQILDDLEEARTLFAQGAEFDGDPVLKGDPEAWKKVVAGFELKVLINLSKKADDADLKVKERFAALHSSSDLMVSSDDNFQLVYSNVAKQLYPLYQNNHTGYIITSSTLIDPMKEYKDRRMFYYAEPSEFQIEEGKNENDWDAYIGIDPSDKQNDINALYSEGKYCGINARYLTPEGEPIARVSFMQQNFILAEGALRGWIDKSLADEYYKKGIRASMEFIQKYTKDKEEYHHGNPIDATYISTYLGNQDIQLNGDFTHDLEMVLLQKYLASYLQHPDNDCFYDNRRTGFPRLPLNPETNLNTDKSKFPVRWMYPQAELDYNRKNVQEAIDRQYGGSDDFNQLMWILQD